MPFSTSSFDRQLPIVAWPLVLGGALLIFFGFVAYMEIRLAHFGYQPTVLDTKSRWVQERARASRLGERALILIGASRIRLDVDLDVLREETGLEPVQLAIEGDSFVPVLASLAADSDIRGTVMVDYMDSAITGFRGGRAQLFQEYYERYGDNTPSSEKMEKALSDILYGNFRSYANEASPLSSLYFRILRDDRAAQYLAIRPDRSRIADYSLVKFPDFYYQRVERILKVKLDLASPDVPRILAQKISRLSPRDNRSFVQGIRPIREMVSAIEARGGRVLFVVMPTSGMVREIYERWYPRTNFWDRFAKEVEAPTLNFADVPSLRDFACPDGSHLDGRDRVKFTLALLSALALGSRKATADTVR